MKASEEQLRTLNDELEQRVERRTRELQETQSQYLHAEKLSAIGKLSASIAHEFNNPLQSVMTILKGLKKTAILEEKDKEMLNLAIGESDRMKNLIRSLQDFNRPSSGKKTLMDVHASIDSLLLLCKSDFKRKGISTVLNYAERLPQILAISDQIKQVILNLLNNAADACIKPDRVITITTWQEKNSIAMAIKDNGIGIKPEEIALIFQPFHSTKSEVKGTGLGLSICHGIVQNHHGEIRVESQPGEGSAFTVLLPIEEE
jgi:signal transduction histidine kinase